MLLHSRRERHCILCFPCNRDTCINIPLLDPYIQLLYRTQVGCRRDFDHERWNSWLRCTTLTGGRDHSPDLQPHLSQLKRKKKPIFYASAGIHNCEWCLVACSTPVSVSWVLSSFQLQDLLTVRKIAHFLTSPRPLLSSCESLICLLGLEVSCSQVLDEEAIPRALSPGPIPGWQGGAMSPMALHSWDAAEGK